MTDQDQGGAVTIYSGTAITDAAKKNHPFSVKVGLAQVLRGGAIVEVSSVDQAKIAESAGACAVIVSDPVRSPAGVLRMPDPVLIKDVKRAVSIPVMARARVGHFVEAQILESLAVDYIDESEIISVADEDNFINKHNFRSPFICGCRDTGEALRRIREGAAMIRIQGDLAGTGNIAETVRNIRSVMGQVRVLNNMDDDEVFTFAKKISAPYDLVAQTKQMGRVPVVQFASGGITTPADAAMMMQLGCDGVFVGPEVFEGQDPFKKVRGIVEAVQHYNDPHVLAKMSSGLRSSAMEGSSVRGDRIQASTSQASV
uniref:Putative pyridoxal biosynthesis protein PDX1.2 n=1 Tax=Noccaea caerulescens TaxID=107243 RepID=A0A1J3DUA2_NOCCA